MPYIIVTFRTVFIFFLFTLPTTLPTTTLLAQSGISLEGIFTDDAQTQVFDFTLPNDATPANPLYFRTWSHAGGTNLAGDIISSGGFNPTLAISVLNGSVVAQANNGGAGLDSLMDYNTPTSGFDIAIPDPLLAGSYFLTLEQQNNHLYGLSGNWAVDLVAPELSLESITEVNIGSLFDISKVTVLGPKAAWNNTANLNIQNGGVFNIRAGGSAINSTGSIGNLSGSFGVATVTGAGSTWTTSNFDIGKYGSGILNIEAGGRVYSDSGRIGKETDSTGVVTVTGTDSHWNNTSRFYIGGGGAGTLNIEAGGSVITEDGFIGNAEGSTGVVTVTGAGSHWNNTLFLHVGNRGNGTLNIQNSGTVTTNNYGYIGFHTSSIGAATVTGSGSHWQNNDELTIGYWGTGTLNIEAGGSVSSDYGYIGYSTGSTGVVTVSGTDSYWQNDRYLDIGNSGTGTLNIQDGGTVTSTGAAMGYHENSTGTVTVTGPGSIWNNMNDLTLSKYGNATLNILNGGSVVTQGTTLLRDTRWGTAQIVFDHGSLTTGSLFTAASDLAGTGTIHTSGLVTDIDLIFDSTHGLQQQLVLNSLPNQNIEINLNQSNASDLGVAYQGAGTLTIAEGVTVDSYDGYLGYHKDSSGGATITGAGSNWNNTYALYVGHTGNGTLNIQDGGTVTNRVGFIGHSTEVSRGAATITGASSTWDNTSELYVGFSGDGTLRIQDGGTVTSIHGLIAHSSVSNSIATVTGAGSSWNNKYTLKIGYRGNGTLNILDGGLVTTQRQTSIGYYSDSTGLIVLNNGTLNTEDLHVGNLGTGTLNIQNNAVVNVANTLSINATSFLNLTSGTLTTPTFNNAAYFHFNFTGGALHAQTFNGNLLNQGGILTPATSPGTITINGAYTQQLNATLQIELGGTTPDSQHDQLNVTGALTLAGALDLQFLNDFNPAPLDTFTIATFDTLLGDFDEILGQTLDSGLLLIPQITEHTYDLVVAIPADFNLDGQVDVADLSTWATGFGATNTDFQFGDANLDGQVDVADLSAWATRFGQTAADFIAPITSLNSATAIPEPSALLLLMGATLSTYRRRRKT